MSPEFSDDQDIRFPVITISVFNDDLNEPIHVDLGSVPPFVAATVLEKVASMLKTAVPAPKITFKGNVLIEPFSHGPITIIDELFETFVEDDSDEDGEDQ